MVYFSNSNSVIVYISSPALCDDLTVGVSVGDWFKYEGTLDYWEADDVVPFPPYQYTTFSSDIQRK
jgi:hypothetical protein